MAYQFIARLPVFHVLTRLIAILVLFAAGIELLAAPASAARRMALVIGINDYSEINDLERAVGDAKAVAKTLRGLDFNVTQVINPNRRKLNRAISKFSRRLKAGDIAFVHFSGHGVEINGDNYLLPADAPRPDAGQSDFIQSEAVSMSRLLRQIEASGARTRLFVIDACRDNPFELSGVRSIGSSRGLARVEAPSGTFIMYSAGYRQQALDSLGTSDKTETSVYTRVLLAKLQQPGKALSQIAKDIRAEVESLARSVGHDQRPAYYDELSSKLILVPAAPPPAKPDKPQVQSLYSPPAGAGNGGQPTNDGDKPKPNYNALPPVTRAYDDTKLVGTCDAYKVFEKTYSTSFYGGLARAWIKKNCGAKVKKPDNQQPQQQTYAEASKACTRKLGLNASPRLIAGSYQCRCNAGYKVNSAGSLCVRENRQNKRQIALRDCERRYGSRADLTYFNPDTNTAICGCKSGYHFNAAKTSCVTKVVDRETKRRIAENDCQRKHGFNSKLNYFNADTNTSICGCRAGYQFNGSRSACVRKERSYAQKYASVREKCVARYGFNANVKRFVSETDFSCGCQTGYTFNAVRLTCEREKVKTRSAMLSDALSSCRRKLGSQARVANLSDNGDFKCGCKAPYKLGAFGTDCVKKQTKKERRAEFNKLCKKKYGRQAYLDKVDAKGTYTCWCGKNRTYDKKTDSCKVYTRKQRRRDAIASCRRQYGKRYVRTVLHKNGTSTCYFRKSRKQAMREARAWCRKRFRKVRRIKLRPIRGGRWQWTCIP